MSIFKAMRAIAPDEKHPIRFPKLASVKLDGIRFTKWEGRVISKSGKPLANLHIMKELALLPEGCDGEIIVGPPNLETTYNTTFRAVSTIRGEPTFTAYIFDLARDTPALWRTEALRNMQASGELPAWAVPVKQVPVETGGEVETLYEKALAAGYEGLILKDPHLAYKWGKSTAKEQHLLKLKPEEDYDAQVVSVYEAQENLNEAFTNEIGETSRSSHQENKVGKGMAGGFIALDLTSGKTIRVGAGKLSHLERREIWLNKEHYIGQYFKYRSMSYGVKDLPRQGRFYTWRAKEDVECSKP